MKHIELFAGCGGMTLGLEAAGFELYFANELSPMAGETFAYNLLHEDLNKKAEELITAEKTLWIKSAFKKDNLRRRLRENPFEARNGEFSDLTVATDLKDKLLVGDIDKLLGWLNENPAVVKKLKAENITLLSGGPPCQSFSLAGKREKNNAKNLLPLSFAKFAGLINPQFVILENVKGITAPFTENGKKYYAWFEVAKAFALEGFVPVCMMLNSKYFGVAQNRPRFILLALRHDVAKKLALKKDSEQLKESIRFFNIVRKSADIENIDLKLLRYYDIESNAELFNGFLFPKVSTPDGQLISASEAIGDLKRTDGKSLFQKSRVVYRDTLSSIFKNPFKVEVPIHFNHEPRNHNYEVKARFRLYQVINEFQNGNRKNAYNVLVGKEVEEVGYNKLLNEFIKYDLFLKNGSEDGYYKKLTHATDIAAHLKAIETRKHSQRALKEDEPAPAQLTIPDDLCHYDITQLRTLTVREMARFQSFPDWFVFKSKVTTGGTSRKFEVPQYTQVGNAVPPLLAKALGDTIITIFKEVGYGELQ